MNSSEITIGIDRRGDRFFAARVESGSGRTQIKALFRFDNPDAVNRELIDGGRIAISVPDSNVIVKRITLEADRSDLNARIAFELCQLLMEDERDLLVDSIDTGRSEQHLGLAVRRKPFEAIVQRTLGNVANGYGEIAGRMRAAALADGFLKFCKPSGGDLISLVDFCDREISIVFIYRGRVIDLAHVSTGKLDLEAKGSIDRAAVELKTIVNFKMDSFFQSGISIPLSALVVMGDRVDGAARRSLAQHFPVDVRAPEFNTGFLPEHGLSEDVPLEKYLVPLGLAAN